MIHASIIGATGYAGVELLRLLMTHPNVTVHKCSSVSFEGKPVSEIYPNLREICDDVLVSDDDIVTGSDVVFASLPAGISEKYARACDAQNVKFIDLGADFRLDEEETYHKWYGQSYVEKDLHDKAVYGLPELFEEDIIGASIIGNPGCYPTSVALGLAPMLLGGMIDTTNIIIDAKSGATGAGRGLSQTTHYPDCNETFSPYKIGQHRHTPEIEQTLSRISKKEVKVTFVPHLLPVNRGIVSTMYGKRTNKITLEELHSQYTEFYENKPFVRVLPLGQTANLKHVRLSNYCDISLHEDPHTNMIIVVSTIDNMVKGAAGQAIQNMNLLFSLEQTTGLNQIPPAF